MPGTLSTANERVDKVMTEKDQFIRVVATCLHRRDNNVSVEIQLDRVDVYFSVTNGRLPRRVRFRVDDHLLPATWHVEGDSVGGVVGGVRIHVKLESMGVYIAPD